MYPVLWTKGSLQLEAERFAGNSTANYVPFVGNQRLNTKLTALMFPNWQDIYNQVEAKHTVSMVEDLRNNAVKSTVFYKNRAYSSLLQLQLSKQILFSSFTTSTSVPGLFFELTLSTIKSPISLRIQAWAALSRGQYPLYIFHLDTTTFWFISFPKLSARGSLAQVLSIFSQKLHFAGPYRFLKLKTD